MNQLSILSNDDFGGRVCQKCNAPEEEYVVTLHAYSAFTKRDAARGDALFLAAQTPDDRLVTVEFHPVPYRLFLEPPSLQGIFSETSRNGVLQTAIKEHAQIRTCSRAVDSACGKTKDLVELRLFSRFRYTTVYEQLKQENVPVAIDGAHDALHGLDALLNLGIPGACVSLRIRAGAAILVDQWRWQIKRPCGVCVHGIPPRFSPKLREVAIGIGPNRSICVGYNGQVAWFGTTESKAFARDLSKIRPTVVVVHSKEKTLRELYQYAPSFFATLFSVLPSCIPLLGNESQRFSPGLGVLIFDAATIPGSSLDVRPCQWLCAYLSHNCLQERLMTAATLHTNTHYPFTSYETFSAAMVLHYTSERMVCELTQKAHAPYNGGHNINPRATYLVDRPVADFDFVSMYPTIACVSNAGKDTYVEDGGHWNLGALGGFVANRRGSLAKVVEQRLEERLRILDDPTMQIRAKELKKSMNAINGMVGNKSNPYADTRVAGCITATGRRLLQACHRHFSEATLAGYTDSLFVELPRPRKLSNDGGDPFEIWMSREVVQDLESRFKGIIAEEVRNIAPSPAATDDLAIQFKCKRITVAGLMTDTAHAYAVAYLTLSATDDNWLVEVQVKGTLKSTALKCTRLFRDALVRASIAGEFLVERNDETRFCDVLGLASVVPTRVMTSFGWKTVVRLSTTSGSRGRLDAIMQYGDGSETRHSFLPRVNGDGLVDVMHVVWPTEAKASVDRRRLTVVAFAESFGRRFSRGQLPLDAYAVDRGGNVLVRLEKRSSKALRMSEAARNGLSLDLKKYHERWTETCIDSLACKACGAPLESSRQTRYGNQEGMEPAFYHERCSPICTLSIDQVPTSVVSRHVQTAASTIIVAGARNAFEAVSRLIVFRDTVKCLPVGEEPPVRSYAQVLVELKKAAVDGKSLNQYLCPPQAFACIPDDQEGSWFCLPTEPTTGPVLSLLHEAVRVHIKHGRFRGDDGLLRAAADYPAHRLRVAPPPILARNGQAPVPAWEEVLNELAKSADRPTLRTTAQVRCQACDRAFYLLVGVCGHLACMTCSDKWKTCAICGGKWRASRFDNSPQMNYHPTVFPFEAWYQYLPITGWCVYCGPDELLYDSSARHIIALARGEAHDDNNNF